MTSQLRDSVGFSPTSPTSFRLRVDGFRQAFWLISNRGPEWRPHEDGPIPVHAVSTLEAMV